MPADEQFLLPFPHLPTTPPQAFAEETSSFTSTDLADCGRLRCARGTFAASRGRERYGSVRRGRVHFCAPNRFRGSPDTCLHLPSTIPAPGSRLVLGRPPGMLDRLTAATIHTPLKRCAPPTAYPLRSILQREQRVLTPRQHYRAALPPARLKTTQHGTLRAYRTRTARAFRLVDGTFTAARDVRHGGRHLPACTPPTATYLRCLWDIRLLIRFSWTFHLLRTATPTRHRIPRQHYLLTSILLPHHYFRARHLYRFAR